MEKEELEKLRKMEGEVRGTVFETDAQYVLKKEGESGLKKLEKRLDQLGYDIDYREVEATNWYPIGLRAISLLVIKDTFGWSDSEMRKMGKNAPKVSFLVKFLLRLFPPLKKLVQEAPRFWRKHYTVGNLEIVEFDEQEKKMAVRLKGIKLHPLFCLYLEGWFEGTYEFMVGQAKARETKCMFKGDPYHEYLVEEK